MPGGASLCYEVANDFFAACAGADALEPGFAGLFHGRAVNNEPCSGERHAQPDERHHRGRPAKRARLLRRLEPGCAATHLAYDAGDDVWQGAWNVPAGSYQYKAALNNSWTENYGLHAEQRRRISP